MVFTQSELQSLKSILKERIRSVELDLQDLQDGIQYLYALADKEDTLNGEFYFKVLNKYCSDQRKQEEKLQKLLQLHQKAKKALGHQVLINREWKRLVPFDLNPEQPKDDIAGE